MDETVYVFKILNPFGYEMIDQSKLIEGEKFTNIVPDVTLKKPVFNNNSQSWEEYDSSKSVLAKFILQNAQDVSTQKAINARLLLSIANNSISVKTEG